MRRRTGDTGRWMISIENGDFHDWNRLLWAGLSTRPVDDWESFLLVGNDAERNAPVERHGFDLNIESTAITMVPCSAYAGEDGFLSFAIANVVGDVRWRLGSWGLRRLGRAHVGSPVF